jgi:hypothetical protein
MICAHGTSGADTRTGFRQAARRFAQNEQLHRHGIAQNIVGENGGAIQPRRPIRNALYRVSDFT